MDNIEKLIKESLCHLPQIKCENDSPNTYEGSGIIFPKTRDGEKRVSEQEAKILFCNLLLKNNIDFSIETPTIRMYKFTGEDKRSGNIDVCIFKKTKDVFQRISCIEFKAHNVKEKDIKKDIEKLICENGKNYFIHILSNADNGTLYKENPLKNKPIINKYITALEKLYQIQANFISLTFYICILKPEFCIIKKTIKTPRVLEDEMKLDYNIDSKEKIITITKKYNNWERIK